jgi:glycosyltransferase involved in cell wall biosynthesis
MPHDAVSTPLHLLGHFVDAFTGGERELPDLADALQGRRECVLWSDGPPHAVYAARGVRQIQPHDFPTGGMLLLGGVHVGVGEWLARARFERIAMRYNLPQHARLFRMTSLIREVTGLDPELLFASEALRLSVGLPGTFEPSLIPLANFLAVPLVRPAGQPFTVGRASRDVLEKHHPDDLMLYRMLAAQGIKVRIMGGTCLAPWLAGAPNIELLPTGSMPVWEFNAGLDVFVYRTGTFHEPYGRVVFEAMASALPVVVTTAGGFAEQIAQGESGLLFDTQEQAYDAVMRLRDDEVFRHAVAAGARRNAQRLHGDEAVQALLDFYLR